MLKNKFRLIMGLFGTAGIVPSVLVPSLRTNVDMQQEVTIVLDHNNGVTGTKRETTKESYTGKVNAIISKTARHSNKNLVFDGWRESLRPSAPRINRMPNISKMLVAKWKQTVTTEVFLTFIIEDENQVDLGSYSVTQIYFPGAQNNFNVVTPTREHYKFAGWQDDYTKQIVDRISTNVTEMILLATWKTIFNLEIIDSFSNKVIKNVNIVEGEKLDRNLLSPSKNMQFFGYFDSSIGGTEVIEATKTTTKVYAQWKLKDTIDYQTYDSGTKAWTSTAGFERERALGVNSTSTHGFTGLVSFGESEVFYMHIESDNWEDIYEENTTNGHSIYGNFSKSEVLNFNRSTRVLSPVESRNFFDFSLRQLYEKYEIFFFKYGQHFHIKRIPGSSSSLGTNLDKFGITGTMISFQSEMWPGVTEFTITQKYISWSNFFKTSSLFANF